MATESLLTRVRTLLSDPVDAKLAASLFATVDAPTISRRVHSFCRDHLGAAVATCDEVVLSVGGIFVLRLESQERVVLKFHSLGEGRWGAPGTLPALTAVYSVQDQLARSGLSCAAVLRAPVAYEGGAVAAMAYLDGSAADDPRQPDVRRAMAEIFAEIARRTMPLQGTPDLPSSRLPSGLWPVPHNVLFDLDAPGGEWIDERGRQARSVLDATTAPPLLLHTDLSAANVRVRDGRVCAIYDMDSLALVDEMLGLGGTAVHHTYTGGPLKAATSRDEARAFVADYERVRGRALTAVERERLNAAAIYAMAYTARCEHAGDPAGERLHESMRARLREAPATGYLD